MTAWPALPERIDAVAAPSQPGAPAFLTGPGRRALTRGDFGERVRASAGAFARAGLEPGATIAFAVRQDATGIAWLLGALRAGLAVVVIDPGLAPEHLVAQCRTAGVAAVVLDGGVAAVMRHPLLRAIAAWRGLRLPAPSRVAPRIWATSPSLSLVPRLDRLAGGDARRPVDPDAPALILFTSGTTGRPRGVVHTQRSLAATMAMAAGAFPLTPSDRVLGAGLHLVAPALLAGAPVLLAPPRGGDRALPRATREADVTHVSLPLHRALAWVALEGAGPSLRSVVLGSAPVRNAGLETLRRRLPDKVVITSVYGLTEHLLVASVDVTERLAHEESDGDLVGRPFPGVRLRIADDGEVWVRGPGLARGYLGDDPTASSRTTDPPAEALPTGDVGRIDAHGRLVLLGRRKEMLIRGGVNIYPSLYEAPLAAAAGLEAAFLVGVPDATGDERVVLVGIPAAGSSRAEARQRLEDVVRSRRTPLDDHARPDAIVTLPAVPRAGRSEKPDREALRAAAAAALGAGPAGRPTTPDGAAAGVEE